MIYSQITYMIGDYDAWRAKFDEMESVRQQYGCTGTYAYSNADNPNELTIVLEWADEGQAKAYFASAELRAAMQAVAQGAPNIKYLNEIV